jgi:GNAT superfamily N-acetyltransferase
MELNADVHEWRRGEYRLTTDRDVVDLDVVVPFLANESYWAQGRTVEEQRHANAASTCFTLIHQPPGAQVGFARAISDDLRFTWLMDVFVLPDHRGSGLGGWITACVVERFGHTTIGLGTADAHGVYAKHGFVPVDPRGWMHRPRNEPPAQDGGFAG